MNQINEKIAEMKAYQLGILSLVISSIFLVFSYLGVGFTTNDDTRYEIWVYNGSLPIDLLKFQGRIAAFIGYYLLTFPHWISKILGFDLFNLVNLIAIAVSVALFSWTTYKVTQQKLFSMFIAVFFIVALQNSWHHNVLTSYTFSMNIAISLLLMSLNLFLAHLVSSSRLLWILSSLVFLLTLFASYEFFLFYIAIFIFIAFYNIKTTATSNRAAILATLYTLLPYLVSIIIFLIAYLACRKSCPGSYKIMNVTRFSFSDALRVIYQYTVSSLPTYVYFHYSGLFSAYSDVTQGHIYTVSNFLEQLKSEWLVKSIVVSYFVYVLLQNRLIVISRRMFIGLSAVSIYAMLVPNILIAVTDKHRTWVTRQGAFLYTTTYFSYFGTVLLIVSGILFFNQIFYGNTLTKTILRKSYVWFITIVIALMCLVTDYSNYYVFKEQKISQQKWVVLDMFIQSGNLDSVPPNSFMYAPSLWERRNIVANRPEYWTQYLTLKYKKNVIVSKNPAELKNRLDKYGLSNVYYLKFSQEPKDTHQFILFAKVNKIVNDTIFLSSDAVIVSNSNRKNFMIFGRDLPVNANSPLTNTAISIDNTLVQRDGNFFSANVTKKQIGNRYTITQLKTIGSVLLDLESISISSYINHQLNNVADIDCFKPGIVFNLVDLSNLSCDFKNILPIGWHGLEKFGTWSTANAEMQINLPKDCQGTNTCDLKLFFGAFNVSAKKPKQVLATINNQLIGEWSIGGPQTIAIPLDAKTLQGQTKDIKIQLQIPDAESPKQIGMSTDPRILGIGLRAYQISVK